ncbi:MAG: S-methyl-5-thioribose-1-phosphate isomerase [Bacillota bacterium]|nr:S-methyl-5-thioribose-1-phosphate isomerase [Bacillota bacterium]
MSRRAKTLEWREGVLYLLDQTRLPAEVKVVECRTHQEVGEAIERMVVRGAPAIGAAAAYGVVLGAWEFAGEDEEGLWRHLEAVLERLRRTRPTAVNLFWALERMRRAALNRRGQGVQAIKEELEKEAHEIAREDVEANQRLGIHGAELVPAGSGILTHCNAGALATVDYGTALAVVREAHRQGKGIRVYADETRPFLQGARLTAWELQEDGIPVTLIVDGAAAYVMKKQLVQLVIVGADRIAANGDVANKIGTYGLAILAREHGIPFYVAAPLSTVDLRLKSGEEIPIEERSPREVTHIFDYRVAPEGVGVLNPAFDVTPNRLVTAIITDRGVVRPPYEENLRRLVGFPVLM